MRHDWQDVYVQRQGCHCRQTGSPARIRRMSSVNVIRIGKGIARKIASVIRECQSAQRRLDALQFGPDLYSDQPNDAPANYAEFRFRTSGPALREPSARQRGRGALTPR